MKLTKEDVDFSKIEFEFGEDWDIFQELVNEYKEAHVGYLSEIHNAINDKNAEQLRISAHTLKGIVANFYSEKLRGLAVKLEQLGREASFEEAFECFVSLKEANECVINLIGEYALSRS